MWSTKVVPTDQPTAEPMPVNIEAAVQNALQNRTDVVAARKSLERPTTISSTPATACCRSST